MEITTEWQQYAPDPSLITEPSFVSPEVNIRKTNELKIRLARPDDAETLSGIQVDAFAVYGRQPDQEITKWAISRRMEQGQTYDEARRDMLDNYGLHRGITKDRVAVFMEDSNLRGRKIPYWLDNIGCSDPHHRVIVATLPGEDEPLGFCEMIDVTFDRRIISWIGALFVRTAFQNYGLGSTLIQASMEEPDARGVDIGVMMASDIPAVDFYERKGFDIRRNFYVPPPVFRGFPLQQYVGLRRANTYIAQERQQNAIGSAAVQLCRHSYTVGL